MTPADIEILDAQTADGGEDGRKEALEAAKAAEMGLAEALNLWVDLSGVEPGGSGRFTFGELSVRHLHREIQEALELDATEITGRMLLSMIVQDYFGSRSFSVDALLNEPAAVASYLAKAGRLANYLRGGHVAGLAEEFSGRLRLALERYGSLTPEVSKLVDQSGPHGDRGFLAVLRRDAMRTLAKLEVHQFLDGDTESPDTQPVYGKHLYRWNNINSMLRAMVGAPSGVTVNMIVSPENQYGVYFVFAIRNGGRLFVFTDKEQTPHPLAESMWRRPDKILAERANRHWFPYDVAGLQFDDEGRAYIDTSAGRSLVAYQNAVEPVKPLSELSPPQVIWLTMMLDLIVEKFWKQSFKAPALSYTGEMVRVATPLLEAARRAGLPVVANDAAVLQAKPITAADLHSSVVDEASVGARADDRHAWLEDRYSALVKEEALDLVLSTSGELLLTADETLAKRSDVVSRNDEIFKRLPQGATELRALDPTSFGTAEQIDRDRKFLARVNYARMLDRHAQSEFTERKEEVVKWVRERMAANLPNLELLLVTPALWVKTAYKGDISSDRLPSVRYDAARGTREFITRYTIEEMKENEIYFHDYDSMVAMGQRPAKRGYLSCHYTGGPTDTVVSLIPETAEQLAWMCGTSVDELPDVLQHWSRFRGYAGNHLLNRVDPILWCLDDRWSDLSFALRVYLSKRAIAALEKRAKAGEQVQVPFAA